MLEHALLESPCQPGETYSCDIVQITTGNADEVFSSKISVLLEKP